MTRILQLFLFIVIFFSLHGCEKSRQKKEVVLPPVKKTIQYNKKEFKNTLLTKLNHVKLDSIMVKAWKKAIQSGVYFPIVRNEKSIKQFANLLKQAEDHALGFYFAEDIKTVNRDFEKIVNRLNKDELTTDFLAEIEIELRSISMKYNQALNFGVLNPKKVYASGYYINHNQPDSTWYKQEFARKDYISYLENFAPNHIEYQSLKRAYQHFLDHPNEFWEALPQLPKTVIRQGDKYKGVPQLRLKFGIKELPDTSAQKFIFDSVLVENLKKFQAEHNLQKDGILGASSMKLLNTSPIDIKNKIEASLERFRWNTTLSLDNLLLVNIPDYRLQVFEDGKRVMYKKIGVGIAAGHSTPEFIDTMQYVVVNPKWNLPYSIASKEILPHAQIDSTYLERNNYKVFYNGQEISPDSVNWNAYSQTNFPFWLVQEAGPGNALGKIKFLFPNEYYIYLHDTPSKYIFNREKRDVSHGCIRLKDPFELGDFLMEGNKEYLKAKQSDENKTFESEKKYPVFITYYTTWADKEGNLQIRADVYDRDQKIIDALNQLKKINEN